MNADIDLLIEFALLYFSYVPYWVACVAVYCIRSRKRSLKRTTQKGRPTKARERRDAEIEESGGSDTPEEE